MEPASSWIRFSLVSAEPQWKFHFIISFVTYFSCIYGGDHRIFSSFCPLTKGDGLGFSRNRSKRMHVQKEIYYKELTFMVYEAEKSQHLCHLQAGDPEEVTWRSCQGPKAREGLRRLQVQ